MSQTVLSGRPDNSSYQEYDNAVSPVPWICGFQGRKHVNLHRGKCQFQHSRFTNEGALSLNFSSIAIELNVPHDEYSSIVIVIELTFVTLRRGFKKKAGLVSFDSWCKDLLHPIRSISVNFCIPGMAVLLILGGAKVSSIASNYSCITNNGNFVYFFGSITQSKVRARCPSLTK